ncbi:hypothetical protein ACGF3G_00735 [Streptomyces sp. NPDC048179]|uniref:hypothetical protein n=1 Tax=Streptomyces sp. NPDC048179 TaxID=3365506 RepID=UPI0037222430
MTTAVDAPVTRMVRSLPAAVHVRALRYVGVTDREIIVHARLINAAQLRRVFRGEMIGWDVERRTLALPIPREETLYATMRSLGARRRLRALHALGWPTPDLAAALGWAVHKAGNVLAEYPVPVIDYLAVCALYDQRWTWVPEDHGIPAGEAEQARLAAEIGQCASPLAWDDEALDDPKARPRTGPTDKSFGAADPAAALRRLDGDNVALSGRTRTLAIAYGARYLDMPWDVMAERLGMDEESLRRSWERIKARVRSDARGAKTWVDEPRFTDDAFISALNKHRTAA